jgi:hypothetical protein
MACISKQYTTVKRVIKWKEGLHNYGLAYKKIYNFTTASKNACQQMVGTNVLSRFRQEGGRL